MANQRDGSASYLSSTVDISSAAPTQGLRPARDEQVELLREVINAQDRTNELLEELLGSMATVQKQRTNELNQWRSANPALSQACRDAAESLSRVQIEFLDRMTEEINDTCEELLDGEFMLHEFIDRYGPRLAHLNSVIQVLAQLSSVPNPANTSG